MAFAFEFLGHSLPYVHHNQSMLGICHWNQPKIGVLIIRITSVVDDLISHSLALHVPQNILSIRSSWPPNTLQLDYCCSIDTVYLRLSQCWYVTKPWVQKADSLCAPNILSHLYIKGCCLWHGVIKLQTLMLHAVLPLTGPPLSQHVPSQK